MRGPRTTDDARAALALRRRPVHRRDDQEWRCHDCEMATTPTPEGGELYRARAEGWRGAKRWTPVGPRLRFLCVGCLEQRLGGRLPRGAFPAVPVNAPSPIDSPRLAS